MLAWFLSRIYVKFQYNINGHMPRGLQNTLPSSWSLFPEVILCYWGRHIEILLEAYGEGYQINGLLQRRCNSCSFAMEYISNFMNWWIWNKSQKSEIHICWYQQALIIKFNTMQSWISWWIINMLNFAIPYFKNQFIILKYQVVGK